MPLPAVLRRRTNALASSLNSHRISVYASVFLVSNGSLRLQPAGPGKYPIMWHTRDILRNAYADDPEHDTLRTSGVNARYVLPMGCVIGKRVLVRHTDTFA